MYLFLCAIVYLEYLLITEIYCKTPIYYSISIFYKLCNVIIAKRICRTNNYSHSNIMLCI